MNRNTSKHLASIYWLLVCIAVIANISQIAMCLASTVHLAPSFISEKFCLVALWAGMTRCSLLFRTLVVVGVGVALIAIYGPIGDGVSDFFAGTFTLAAAFCLWGFVGRQLLSFAQPQPKNVRTSIKDAALSIMIVSIGLAVATRFLVEPGYDWKHFFRHITANLLFYVELSTASIPVLIIATQRRVNRHLLALLVTSGVILVLAVCLQVFKIDQGYVAIIGMTAVSLFLDSTLLRLGIIWSESAENRIQEVDAVDTSFDP